MPLVGDGYAFSLLTTPNGASSFPTPICGPSYTTFPMSSGAISPDSLASPSVFTFDTVYQPPAIRPARKRVKVEPLRPDVLSVLQSESPASTSESAFATPRLNSLPSLLSGTASTIPTPDRMCSPPSDVGSEDEPRGEETERMFLSPALRRLSGPVFPVVMDDVHQVGSGIKSLTIHERPCLTVHPESCTTVRCWGVDRGIPDWDLGRNDDEQALSGSCPIVPRDQNFPVDVSIARTEATSIRSFGTQRSQGYYDESVHVVIPGSLSPIPDCLLQNKMNLLYFHHFLNHTARVLVPHDDPESNPFRTVLPPMAIANDNLLNLLLAYSAAHRARYLGHPEPRVRIMTFVKDILASLLDLVAQVVEEPETVISTADLATTIMMASLEIISPASLGVVTTTEQSGGSIPWQSHLRLAREIISHRPGGLRRMQSDRQDDQACAFLWSWFGYLDVLGSLTGGRGQLGSNGPCILDYEKEGNAIGVEGHGSGDDENQIDCIMGFTPRCAYILAKVAELARTSDAARIDPETHTIRPDWTPDEATVAEAAKLRATVEQSLLEPSRPCRHVHATPDVVKWDRDQMAATNEAYHWAALIHLHKRVLGLSPTHEDVQASVGKIISCLDRIEHGGTAETCLLFPIFTAGCELTDESARETILARVRTIEATGMTQVSDARKLMEKVWQEGQPWETLLSTEFIG